ncbi:sensor histidine kinase [Flavisphingomonas formosensis]|uniref:sensor histidine kinase n=1 Tax=Flavisphingomonas formosensis TaxID=861534 RepID=UPI001E585D00|nr:HAMP domain-containing sensor histidine kinase [Sphingomonas formosensis]
MDLLAQGRGQHGPVVDEAYDMVRFLRRDVPLEVRAEVARGLVGRALPQDLVALFAEEPGPIAAPIIGTARLPDEVWINLLPSLSPTARALLRNRRDLGPDVAKALTHFGLSDFGIPAPESAHEAPELPAEESAGAILDLTAPLVSRTETVTAAADPVKDVPPLSGPMQIRDLMARIDAFRRTRRGPPELSDPPGDPTVPSEDFRFETGADGVVLWVDGAPRGPLIGMSIATPASGPEHGVDGHAAGAYRQRAPFRDARLTVAGVGAASGEWRISGVPFFDHADGRFTGYRGSGRRPRADEMAPRAETAQAPASAAEGLYGSGLMADSLRQLVHELRTPINAISGFAEMISRQMLGPVAFSYRERAEEILAQARQLLAAVDDLDMAARIDTRRLALRGVPVDAAALLLRLHGEYEPVADGRSVQLKVRLATGLPPLDADPIAVERMYARLLAATIGLAQAGETIAVALTPGEAGTDSVALSVGRPALLAGREERTLLDPGYSPEGDWPDAPALGLGFALRLVRNLANAAHGTLVIEADRFYLGLPAKSDTVLSGEGSG